MIRSRCEWIGMLNPWYPPTHDALLTCFLFCCINNWIQQLFLLFERAIKFADILIYHVCVGTGNASRQFALAFFRFRVMYNHMDWSTCSCDTTHLLRYFNLWERSCPLLQLYIVCFLTYKLEIRAFMLSGSLESSFVVSFYQENIKDTLGAYWAQIDRLRKGRPLVEYQDFSSVITVIRK